MLAGMPETPRQTLARDTSPEAEEELLARLRAMAPWEKMALMSGLIRSAEELSLAGLRARHPEASEEELFLRLAALRLDRATMLRVYGWDPEEQGR